MSNAYDDIINLPHHISTTRPHMSLIDRAAQFSPFAALTGYGAAIAETGRLTDERIEMDESEKIVLNAKLNGIQEQLDSEHIVTITYFEQDEKKAGGAYITVTGAVKKIDTYQRIFVMESGTEIPFNDILAIEIE